MPVGWRDRDRADGDYAEAGVRFCVGKGNKSFGLCLLSFYIDTGYFIRFISGRTGKFLFVTIIWVGNSYDFMGNSLRGWGGFGDENAPRENGAWS